MATNTGAPRSAPPRIRAVTGQTSDARADGPACGVVRRRNEAHPERQTHRQNRQRPAAPSSRRRPREPRGHEDQADRNHALARPLRDAGAQDLSLLAIRADELHAGIGEDGQDRRPHARREQPGGLTRRGRS